VQHAALAIHGAVLHMWRNPSPHIGHLYQFNYTLFVIAVVPHMWRNLSTHMKLLSVCVMSVFVRIELPCPEFVIANLPGNWLPSPRLDRSRLRSLCFPSYRRYQCLSSSNPDIGTQTQFKVHSAPTDCMGSRNQSLICRGRDLNPGPSARKANALTVAPPINDMQRVLNEAARLLMNVNRSQPNLRLLVRDNLHWLPMPERIDYKLCSTTYKALHGSAPAYLSELCKPITTQSYCAHLRSADKGDLIVPRHKLAIYGPRAFAIAGPTKWNNLPVTVREPSLSLGQFLSQLKTFLYRRSYGLHHVLAL
jgi:hypothetical protein